MERERTIETAPGTRSGWCARMVWMALALASQVLICHAAEWGMQVRDAPAGSGAELIAVVPQSPAAAAGLRAGDIVIHCEDFLVRSAAELANIMRLAGAKETLALRVSRDGWEKLVVLAARATPVQPQAPPPPPKPWFGLQVSEAASGQGAMVIAVSINGPAAQAGLRSGDLISQADGRPLAGAAELASLTANWPIGRPLRLTVTREGWLRDMNLTPVAAPPGVESSPPRPSAPSPPAPAAPPPLPPGSGAAPYPAAQGASFAAASIGATPPAPASAVRPAEPAAVSGSSDARTVVVVGDFQVKAATANTAIGQGLREILVTALFNSGRFIVVERGEIALPQLAGERELSRSSLARPGEAIPEGQMDVADIMIYGAVTEFELEARGSSFQVGVAKLPLGIGRDSATAHMAIDVRVVDVVTGRVLGAQRIAGEAKGGQTRLEVAPSVRGYAIPVSLASYKNTPMEEAIRACMDKAVTYVASAVPRNYFHHP